MHSAAQDCATPPLALQHADRVPRSHLCFLAGGEPCFPLRARKTASADAEANVLRANLAASAPMPSQAQTHERSRRRANKVDRGAPAGTTGKRARKGGNRSSGNILAMNAGLNPTAALAAAIAASKT